MVTSARHELIKSGDGTVDVSLRGTEGPLAVLVPSLGRAAPDFDELAIALAGAGWRTAALNPRGVGGSKSPREEISLHDLAADVGAVVEALDGAPAAIIGHAFGNRVSRCLAADRPDLVRSVVLLAAGGRVPMAPDVQRAMRALVRPLPPEEHRAAIQTVFFAKGNDPTPFLTGNYIDVAIAQVRAGRNTEIDDWWGGGSAPILVIQGLEDRCASVGNGHMLREAFGDRVEVIDIPGASHALLPEQPETIARHILEFLSR
jgi:pimeloyl-ACP methyl ester carboxylesterase